jgi:hypothetical protein
MKATILMSVYNTAQFLPEAIESVLNQTVQDFEFLIIDDGSTDGSLAILENYAAQDQRIRLIAQQNTGCAKASNRGFTMTDADWIFRFDSDDVMYPRRLERQLQFIESHPSVKVVSCIVDYIDEHGTRIMASKPVLTTVEDWQDYYRKCRPVIIPHTGAALHRRTALDMGGYDYDCFSDTYLFSRMVEAGHLIMVQPETLGAYRVHSTSIMSRNIFWGEVGGAAPQRAARGGLGDLPKFVARVARPAAAQPAAPVVGSHPHAGDCPADEQPQPLGSGQEPVWLVPDSSRLSGVPHFEALCFRLSRHMTETTASVSSRVADASLGAEQ